MANYSGGTPGESSYTPLGGTQQTQTTPDENLIQQLMNAIAPQQAAGQVAYNTLQQQQSLINPQLQSQLGYNTATAGQQLGQLGLSAQQIGIQQTGNVQQQQQAAAQQGFEGQQWGLEQQQYGIQQGQYPEQYAEAALSYQNALRNTQGAQAIGGTQNTVGGRADISTLGQQYGFQLQDINRAQTLSQLAQASAGVGQQAEVSGYNFQQQQLQNAARNLQITAQENGLSQDQVTTLLQYGNQQAGIGAMGQYQNLSGQMATTALNNLQNAEAAISASAFKAGINSKPTGG